MGRFALRVLAAVYGVTVLVAAALLALVLGTFTVLPLVVLPRGKRERYAIVPATWWARIVVRWLLWVDDRVDGGSTVPEGQGAMILCNHRSWLDPLLLMFHTRSNGLSKSAIFYLPVLGQYGWLAGAVFFDRQDKHQRARARQEVLDLIRGGHRLQVFPEGTRTRTGELAERVYLLLPMDCWREGLPVQCCAVWGTERVLPPGVFGAFPGQRVRLRIGRTLHPKDFPDARRFGQACWDEVVGLVEALRAEEEPHRVQPRDAVGATGLRGSGV